MSKRKEVDNYENEALFVLKDGPTYITSFPRAIAGMRRNGTKPSPTKLQNTINILIERGYICEAESPQDADPRRRYLGLTDTGRAELRVRVQNLAIEYEKKVHSFRLLLKELL